MSVPAFRIGARVRSSYTRRCTNGQMYRIRDGRVRRVESARFNPEVHAKGVGEIWGPRPPKRIYSYEVSYRCPRCGQPTSAMFFGPQLIPLN